MNYFVILAVVVAAFVGAHIWYGPVWGKTWQKIHGMDCADEAMKQEMMQGMWKLLITELITMTMFMIGVAFLVFTLGEIYGSILITFFIWLGLSLPTTISDIIWGGDKREYMIQKISILLGYRLIVLLFAGFIFGMWL